MVCKYRVTLQGIKGFYRLYLIDEHCSLYGFHKRLRADLEFPVDQPILFKALGSDGGVVARYALMDIGFGTVDAVSIADTLKAGVESFVYFYDIQARKSVIITFEGKEEGEVLPTGNIRLLETKGPVPIEFEHGYVAFEDLPKERKRLPDEEDDDDDEEDTEDEEDTDDDDEEEVIYDENEE